VEIAAFGFDPDTFAPTYRLVYGSPGRSLALEIAARLGIPASIISTARAYRSERETQLSEHLARMEKELNALDHERRLTAPAPDAHRYHGAPLSGSYRREAVRGAAGMSGRTAATRRNR
jgi:dsDNA-specific endonuclease/ATPase MutS2